MTAYGSLAFFLLLAALVTPALVLGLLGRSLRGYAVAASAVGVIALLARTPAQLAALGGFLVAQVALARFHLWFVGRHGRTVTWERRLAAGLALLPLVVSKAAGLFDSHLLGFLGISYLTFRAIQVVLEISDGLVTELPVWQYVHFLTFFPTLASGPIDRSRRFALDLSTRHTPREYAALAGEGLRLVVLGAAYKFIAAALLASWAADTGRDLGGYVAYAYLYGLQLFFDFAGYSWMAVGVSYLLGVRTPVNFRRPFLAESIKDFWNRWHITLSFWFRDYVYSRLVMALIKRKVFTNRQVAGRVAMVVNMGLMGLWHGTAWHFVLYGLYHGVLLVAHDVYERNSAFHKAHRKQLWYRAGMIVLTFHLVVFGFLIFSGRLVTV